MKHRDFEKKYYDNNVQDSINTNLNNLHSTELSQAQKFCNELRKLFGKIAPDKVSMWNGYPIKLIFSDGSEVGIARAFNETGYFKLF